MTQHPTATVMGDARGMFGHHGLQSGASLSALFDDIRRRDPYGHAAHTFLAALHIFTLPLVQSPASISFGVLVGITVLRLPRTWPTYAAIARDRIGWLFMAWMLWHAASILWSLDQGHGLSELGTFRVVALPLLLWPVLDRVTFLIFAFLLGVVTQNIVQLGQGLGWLERPRGVRLRGLLHPIQTGAMCAIAMCWHISGATAWRGYRRWLSVGGLIIAGLGLAFTGSRGPWISAIAAVPVTIMLITMFSRERRRAAMAMGLAMIALAGLVWLLSSGVISKRIETSRIDMQKVMAGDFDMDIGTRLARWEAAWQIFKTSPIIGVGAGGYREAAKETTHARRLRNATNAHSIYMHTLAVTGIVGFALMLSVMIGAVFRAWAARSWHPHAYGTIGALLSWLIGAAFDVYQNGQLFGTFALFIAVTLPVLRAPRTVIYRRDAESAETETADVEDPPWRERR